MNPLLLWNLGGAEIALIALLILLLFGGKKIPELMRGLGTGVKNFKEGMNGVKDKILEPETEKTAEKTE
ncbi:MAG: twin-arginine translocase TatA/TatE family subunit [Prevotellaceae bacterium]|jgi:sec-independent protein translocase protein TatA|nr:twin-arginine translocase TatA/TatE family subunit [Prevotellaceae bacterium]